MAFVLNTLKTDLDAVSTLIEAESAVGGNGTASDQTTALAAYEAQAKICKASASTITALIRCQTAINSLLRAAGYGPVVGATDTTGG